MDPKGDTKQDRKPGQAQSPELPDSASQADEPGSIKIESPRKCKVCGGPNHYGCGCEAKLLGMIDTEAPEAAKPQSQTDTADLPTIHYAIDGVPLCRAEKSTSEHYTISKYEVTCPVCQKLLKPAKPLPELRSLIVDVLSLCTDEDVAKLLESEIDVAKNIKIMVERSGAICDCFFDVCQYLKVISEDLKTIKDEVKNAAENKN